MKCLHRQGHGRRDVVRRVQASSATRGFPGQLHHGVGGRTGHGRLRAAPAVQRLEDGDGRAEHVAQRQELQPQRLLGLLVAAAVPDALGGRGQRVREHLREVAVAEPAAERGPGAADGHDAAGGLLPEVQRVVAPRAAEAVAAAPDEVQRLHRGRDAAQQHLLPHPARGLGAVLGHHAQGVASMLLQNDVLLERGHCSRHCADGCRQGLEVVLL
mmetsp:Transcript_121766/g.355819  ORF Transcript_121766/g.355819 Transcript_121766/m.355819 type:complete len:214 (+) Transcript_121766:105-746(+)